MLLINKAGNKVTSKHDDFENSHQKNKTHLSINGQTELGDRHSNNSYSREESVCVSAVKNNINCDEQGTTALKGHWALSTQNTLGKKKSLSSEEDQVEVEMQSANLTRLKRGLDTS